MTMNTIFIIATIIITVLLLGVGVFFYLRDKTLDDIRADVYQLFLEVEHNPDYVKAGKQKMKWVLSQARALLPGWLQPFIPDTCLEKIVEGWFRAVKDLLDDGKVNKSNTGEV